MNLNPFAISGLLIVLSMLPSSIAIAVKGKGKSALLFSCMNAAVIIWGIGSFWFSSTNSPEVAYKVWTFTYIAVIFIPVLFYHCVVHIVNNKIVTCTLPVVYAQGIFFTVMTLMGKMASGTRLFFDSFYWTEGSPIIYPASFIAWLIVVSLASTILAIYYIKSRPEAKKPLYMLLAGMPVGFGGGSMNFLPTLGWNIYPWGNFLVPVYYLMISYAVLYDQFLGITVILRKGIVYVLLIVTISIMYLLSIVVFQPVIDSFFGGSSIASGMLAAILLGVVYAPMRLRIEQLIDSTIFKSYNEEIIKEKQIMEHELVRSEKFKMVSKITKGLIQEIKAPLATIKSCTQVNRDNIDDEETICNSAQKIDKQVDKINVLLHQLLKFSNPSSPKIEKTVIYDVFDDVISIVQFKLEEKDIKIVKNFNTSLSILLKIDPVQIRQAMYNIMVNGIEAMSSGGTLSISTAICKSADSPGTVVGDYFEITISDTGRGIPPEGLKNIFDPFYSPTAKRAGLGLSTTHRIIREHKGHISVKSQIHEGTTFTIMLPMVS